MAGAKAEKEAKDIQLKQTTAEAARLEKEPKNEELINIVADLEKRDAEMTAAIEDARGHAGNAKHAQQVKKEIDSKASIWRQRKRQCIDFISNMEESTEGTIR